jgi:hypothetical protein
MAGFSAFIWNFGIRVATFVLFSCVVVFIVGFVAHFIFQDATKASPGAAAGPGPLPPPAPQPGGPGAAPGLDPVAAPAQQPGEAVAVASN